MAGDEVCKCYFHLLEPKSIVVDKAANAEGVHSSQGTATVSTYLRD